MLFSTVSSVFVPGAAAEAKSPAKEYEIYPTPHSMEYGNGMLSLEKGVQVIYDDPIDEVTKRKVEKVFTNNGLEAPSIVEEPSKDKINLLVGVKDSNGPVDQFAAEHVDSQGMDFDQKDAYQLDINDNNIVILGKDTDASFYGTVTLEAILAQSSQNVLRNLSIKDFANTEIRGFIEGYYGIPWSNEDRISLMKFGGKYKMNSYIFAPKDDPYHRGKWEELYPKEKLDEIKEMAKVGNETKTRFVWSISPLGEVAELARREGQEAAMAILEENTEKMLAKFDQLYDVGVRQFGVLGDDVGNLPLDYVVQLMNSVSEWADEKGDVRDTLYTPASYNSGWAWNPKELNAYEKGFADNIHILWTGSTTAAPVVQSTIDVFKNKSNDGVVRRDPLFWLNWPVNDVDMSRVFLGKGEMLQPGIENLAGVVTNPMQEAEASKISLFAIADYTWNTVDFDAQKSWDDSFKYIEPDATEELHELSKHMSDADPNGLRLSESEDIKELLETITEKVNKGESLEEIAPEAIAEFQKIVDAANGFFEESKNEKLKEELEPFVNALRDMVLADIEFMYAALAIEEGNIEEAWNTNSKALSIRKQSLNYDRPLIDGTMKAKPAQKRLQPFTDNLQEKITQGMEKLLDVGITQSKAHIFTNVADYEELALTEKPAVTSIDTAVEVELDRNEYIGLELSRIKDLSNIEATMADDLTIQSSLNGIEWETVKDLNKPSDARYVRLINKTAEPIHFILDTFKVGSNEVEPKTMENTNVKLHESSPLNILDGDLSTHTWFAEPQTEGQFITYNLGQKINLESLKLYVNKSENDFPRHAVIESSLDGKEWNTAMTIGNQDGPNKGEMSDEDHIEDIFNKLEDGYRTKEVKDIGQEARFLRFRVTQTKQGTANWLRMQEIQINDGAFFPEINDPTITTTTNVNIGSGVGNIADGKLNTKFEPANGEAGEILYHIGEAGAGITGITLMEDPENVSNSKVSVRTLNGWEELGTTESGYTFLHTTEIDPILDLKIEWTDGNAPTLYEVKMDKVEDNGNVESTILAIKSLVNQYADEGKIENSRDARLLETHLTSIDHYVKKDLLEKAVKHMDGFKQLVNQYQENGQMDKKAAKTLIRHADNLIEKW